MIMEHKSVNMTSDLCEYDAGETEGVPYAVYYANIYNYIGHHIPIHWHGGIEIGFVINGIVRIFIENKEILVSKGQGFFINSNVFHGYFRAEGDAQFSVIVFDPLFISGGKKSDPLYKKYLQPLVSNENMNFIKLLPHYIWQSQCIVLLEKIYHEAFKEQFGYELSIRNKLTEIVSNISLHCTSKNDFVPSYNVDEDLKKMIAFISDNYSSNLTVEDIAKSANLSERECYRRFKNNIAVSPLNYLNSVRIKRAMEMLTNTDASITDICFDVGFKSSSYFSALFKRTTTLSPSEYRSTH